jgi:hypothetical protein
MNEERSEESVSDDDHYFITKHLATVYFILNIECCRL